MTFKINIFLNLWLDSVQTCPIYYSHLKETVARFKYNHFALIKETIARVKYNHFALNVKKHSSDFSKSILLVVASLQGHWTTKQLDKFESEAKSRFNQTKYKDKLFCSKRAIFCPLLRFFNCLIWPKTSLNHVSYLIRGFCTRSDIFSI